MKKGRRSGVEVEYDRRGCSNFDKEWQRMGGVDEDNSRRRRKKENKAIG